MPAPWKESYDKPRQNIKKQRHHFVNKGPYSQSYGFSSSHVQMWELDHKEGRALKNWCFWTVVLEKTLENHLDRKEIKPVNSKWNKPWILVGKADIEAPILWSPDAELIYWKRPKCWKSLKTRRGRGNRWRKEGEFVGWHHWLNGHQVNCSVMSGSSQPHGLQHTRFPCPSPTPGACSNSCPLSQ